MKLKIVNVMVTLEPRGSMMLEKIFHSLAPSIRAASTRDSGNDI